MSAGQSSERESRDDKDAVSLCVSRTESELARLIEWGRVAESRVALILPLATAMFGALAVLALSVNGWTVFGGITTSFSAVLLALSIVFAAYASFPHTERSLIYFGCITTRDLKQYEAEVQALTSDTYLADLISQCHRNAQIVGRKYIWIQRSISCLFLATLPWVVSLFILYAKKT